MGIQPYSLTNDIDNSDLDITTLQTPSTPPHPSTPTPAITAVSNQVTYPSSPSPHNQRLSLLLSPITRDSVTASTVAAQSIRQSMLLTERLR